MKEIALHILDIVQNSVVAEATKVSVEIAADTGADEISITITDDGYGMEPSYLKRVTDPFTTSRTTRKVGLGLPLFKANAEQAGGRFVIRSQKDEGTVVEAVFGLSHIDRIPMGDLAGTMITLIMGSPDVDFTLSLRCGEREFVFSTLEVREILGPDVPLVLPDVVQWMNENLVEGIKTTFGGVNL